MLVAPFPHEDEGGGDRESVRDLEAQEARGRSRVLSFRKFHPPGFAFASLTVMYVILRALGMVVADLFKSRCRLEAENLLLRHQLSIARRAPPRPRLFGSDRVLLV